MKWDELLRQPDGVVFIKEDSPSTAQLFIKRASLGEDMLIEPIFDLNEGPQRTGWRRAGWRRIGWRGMDATIRNSCQYHVLSQAERNKAVLILIGPYVLLPEDA